MPELRDIGLIRTPCCVGLLMRYIKCPIYKVFPGAGACGRRHRYIGPGGDHPQTYGAWEVGEHGNGGGA